MGLCLPTSGQRVSRRLASPTNDHHRPECKVARERRGVTANEILRAAGTVHEAGEEPNSELVAKVVLPVLSAAEQEFGQALSRISLDDMVHRAASMATERVATKAA